MNWMPGWDSIEAAGWWSSFWFWFGIACLLALGGSEVASHWYGLRKEALVAQQDITNQRQHDADAAQMRQQLTDTQQKQAWRDISPQDLTALTEAVKPFKGQEFIVAYVSGDDEGERLAARIYSALIDGGWASAEASVTGAEASMFEHVPIGVVIFVSETDIEARTPPPAVQPLADTFFRLGLIREKAAYGSPNVWTKRIKVVVGKKPVPSP